MLKSLVMMLCILSYISYANPPEEKTIEDVLSIDSVAEHTLRKILGVGGSFKDAINLFASFKPSTINLAHLEPKRLMQTFDVKIKQISLGEHTGCLLTDKHDILYAYTKHINAPEKAWALDTYGAITCAITYKDRSISCWKKGINSSIPLINVDQMNIQAITVHGWNEAEQGSDHQTLLLNGVFFIDSQGDVFGLPMTENFTEMPAPTSFFTQQKKESIKFKAVSRSHKLFCAISLEDEVYCENYGKANLKVKAIAMSDNLLYAITQDGNEVVYADLRHTMTNNPETITLKPLTTKDQKSYRAKDIQANHVHMCMIEPTLADHDDKNDHGFIRCFEKKNLEDDTQFFPISNLSAPFAGKIAHLAINKNAYNFSESIPSTVCAVRIDNNQLACSIIHLPLAPHPDQKNNVNGRHYYLHNVIFEEALEIDSAIPQLSETPYATEDKNFKPLSENVRDIAVGSNFVCSLDRNQVFRCSVLGFFNTQVHILSSPAGGFDNPSSSSIDAVIQLSAGKNHVCALTEQGMVDCWHIIDNVAPIKLKGHQALPKMNYITSGDHHNCGIIKENSYAYCWPSHIVDEGSENAAVINSRPRERIEGDIFFPNNMRIKAPKPSSSHRSYVFHHSKVSNNINAPENLGPIESIAAGATHTCAIQKEKPYDVICWGKNEQGQLNVPRKLPLAEHIRAKEHMTCVKEKRSGHIRCWGYDKEWISDEPVRNNTAYPLISLDQEVNATNRRNAKVFAYINQNNRIKILQPYYRWENITDISDWVRLQSYNALLEIFKKVGSRIEKEQTISLLSF